MNNIQQLTENYLKHDCIVRTYNRHVIKMLLKSTNIQTPR